MGLYEKVKRLAAQRFPQYGLDAMGLPERSALRALCDILDQERAHQEPVRSLDDPGPRGRGQIGQDCGWLSD